MGDVAWITLELWPWDDAWLQEDDELAAVFRELDLTDGGYRGGTGWRLAGAMNGDIVERLPEVGGGVVLEGEMSGGSYEIRNDSRLLEMLAERGIAYRLVGDAKYDWDGDETWWHPGMAEPLEAQHGSNDRVLDRRTYEEMRDLSLPPAVRAANVSEKIRDAEAKAAAHREGGRESAAVGMDAAAEVLRESLAALIADPPEPVPLEGQITAFFDADPYAWKPEPGYRPALKTAVAAVSESGEQDFPCVVCGAPDADWSDTADELRCHGHADEEPCEA